MSRSNPRRRWTKSRRWTTHRACVLRVERMGIPVNIEDSTLVRPVIERVREETLMPVRSTRSRVCCAHASTACRRISAPGWRSSPRTSSTGSSIRPARPSPSMQRSPSRLPPPNPEIAAAISGAPPKSPAGDGGAFLLLGPPIVQQLVAQLVVCWPLAEERFKLLIGHGIRSQVVR